MTSVFHHWQKRRSERVLVVLLLGAPIFGCGRAGEPLPAAESEPAGRIASRPLSAPAAVLAPPDSLDPAARPSAANYAAQRLEETFAHQRTFAIVEGVVLSSVVEVVPTRDPQRPETIASRHRVRVRRAWKSDVPAEIDVWTYGGTLAPEQYPNFQPRGMRTSHEAHLAPGDEAILALSESVRFATQRPLWRALNGEEGVLHLGGRDAAAALEPRARQHLDATYRRFEKEGQR